MLTVGVLALQGDFAAHQRAVQQLGHVVLDVKTVADLDRIDALVLPGGESTTMLKMLRREELFEPIAAHCRSGAPVLGTCAGAILLAREALHHPVPTLGLLDAVAVRNAYGTQVDSFAAPVDEGAGYNLAGLRCVFIRAPQLEQLGAELEVCARVDGRPVLVRQANLWAATFHPELTPDPRLHQLLLRS